MALGLRRGEGHCDTQQSWGVDLKSMQQQTQKRYQKGRFSNRGFERGQAIGSRRLLGCVDGCSACLGEENTGSMKRFAQKNKSFCWLTL